MAHKFNLKMMKLYLNVDNIRKILFLKWGWRQTPFSTTVEKAADRLIAVFKITFIFFYNMLNMLLYSTSGEFPALLVDFIKHT